MNTPRFSTFEGVFTPCLLSILGVIMYLRLGWVVGEIGLWKTWGIIFLANGITIATALCMSSIVTNIRIGAGGAFSMITKSLGVEIGGAIGLPLYISQAVSVAFYIAGFTECWLYVFPSHTPLMISLAVWIGILCVTYISAKLAFRIQYLIMAVIVFSLVSIVLGKPSGAETTALAMPFSHTAPFWYVFAVFFPAVTGILAGVSMSGELKEPKESIPKGTLSAIFLSLIIYLGMAWIFAERAPASLLKTNYYVAITLGRWPKLVIAGIMGATLSSALSMAVSSPRILLALGQHHVLPFSNYLKKVNARGEPIVAISFTFLIALITILFSSLNQIAELLTMIFLITYGMINLTVFIEQSIGIVSFRPSFKISRWVSFLGSVGCLVAMFVIDFRFSILAFLVIAFTYMILLKRGAHFYSPDVRSGVLVYLAEKFVKIAGRLPYYPKIWKPNVLVPITHTQNDPRIFEFLRDVLYPSGRLTVIQAIRSQENKESAFNQLKDQLNLFKENNIFLERSILQHDNPAEAFKFAAQTLRGMVFPPNSLFYIYNGEDPYVEEVSHWCVAQGLGIIILVPNERIGFSQRTIINLWIRRESPNIDLAVLIALQVEQNWGGTIRLVQAVDKEEERQEAFQYLSKLKEIMRLPESVEIDICVGEFLSAVAQAPMADLNIFGMQENIDILNIKQVAAKLPTATLFIKDSKYESALA